MADRITPSSPLGQPKATQPISIADRLPKTVAEVDQPSELKESYIKEFLQARLFGTSTDWGAIQWDGLNLKDLSKARKWQPGEAVPSGKEANGRITETYDAIDRGMRSYLGQPPIANWTTFGKYASREAGLQVARLEALEALVKGDVKQLVGLAAEFFRQPGALVAMGTKLWATTDSSQSLWQRKDDFLRRVDKLHDALVYGNTQIMLDIAPAFDAFLRAEKEGEDGITKLKSIGYGRAPLDPQGFLLGAFERYRDARQLTERLADNPKMSIDEARALIEQRRQLVFEANVLIGIEEQMLCLQHPKAFGDPEVAEMVGPISDGMTLKDANRTIKLLPNGGNWADFATRMGFEEVPLARAGAIAITGHDGVTRGYVPHSDPKKREGTIYEYFRTNLDMKLAIPMQVAKPEALPRPLDDPRGTVRDWVEKAVKGTGRAS